MGKKVNLVAHYTLAEAKTWGCVLGELFDYVNGVCDPNNAFAPGDYGPSGEDVRHRFVLAGTFHAPGGIQLTTLTQAESARPFTIVNADSSGRISVDGVPESLDQVRGTPYVQVDLRVARPFHFGERWELNPFVEFFSIATLPARTMSPVSPCFLFHQTRRNQETSQTFVPTRRVAQLSRFTALTSSAFRREA